MIRNKRVYGPRATVEKREQAKRQKTLKVSLPTFKFTELPPDDPPCTDPNCKLKSIKGRH